MLIKLWSYRYKALALVLLVLSLYLFNAYNTWTHSWSLRFQSPIKNFIIIEPVPQSQFQVNLAPRSEILALSERLFPVAKAAELDPKTLSTEDYIRYVFGKDARMALAISQAENGSRKCDRWGVNTDKSIDFGVFQINTVHMKRFPVSSLVDCHKNVDAAKVIFDEQGWTPWVTYNTGAYKKFLTK